MELEYDIHKQWPFGAVAASRNDDVEEEEEKPEPEETNIDPENIMEIKEIFDMARAEMANRNHQNYQNALLDRIENGYKHLKDTTDRANQLSQYLRYKTPSTQDRLEEARMYPPEDDFTFTEEEDGDDNKFLEDSDDFELDDEEEEESEREPLLEQTLYTRLKPIKISADHFRVPISFDNKHNTHAHEDYKFKEGEEFPHSIAFQEAPVAEDPAEFGVGPSDPRFYRDMVPAGNIVAATQRQDIEEVDIPKIHFTHKPKVNSRSDSQKPIESILNEDIPRGSSNRDVEVVPFKPSDLPTDTAGVYIIAVVAGISAAATVGLIAVGIGWYNLQKHMKNAEDTDYPSYGIVGPNKDYEKKDRDEAGDRRLAQSAQMYHYQHQKQQIIAMGRNPQGHGSQSDTEEEEDEEGNYTVYECPGLASIEGPLEVKNPMFDDDQLATPSQTPSKPTNAEDNK